MQTEIVHEGLLDQAQEKGYVHLPFTVPGGTVRLDITLRYGNQISADPLASGGNTLDLGLFDERGIAFMDAGFRGWSGSERLSVFVAETEATPGYVAGPLHAGLWHVFLGLYKIAAAGCPYRVAVTITSEPGHVAERALPSPLASLPCSAPPARLAPWLCGELHCHSWHSDGECSPAEIVALARQRGLDFLAITDHNNATSQRDLANAADPGLILIPGFEVTTFKGHFNVWGSGDWVDFRITHPDQMAAALQRARALGGVTSCNHPKPYGPPWDYDEVTGYDCVEVWNGAWPILNQMALDHWLRLLASGRRVPAVAGSDWHRLREVSAQVKRAPGAPATWVRVPGTPTAAGILRAIRQGRIALSHDVNGPLLDLRAGAGDLALGGDALPRPASGFLPVHVHVLHGNGGRLLLLDQTGVIFAQTLRSDDEHIVIDVAVSGSLYVRAELRAAAGDMLALSNPVYIGA